MGVACAKPSAIPDRGHKARLVSRFRGSHSPPARNGGFSCHRSGTRASPRSGRETGSAGWGGAALRRRQNQLDRSLERSRLGSCASSRRDCDTAIGDDSSRCAAPRFLTARAIKSPRTSRPCRLRCARAQPGAHVPSISPRVVAQFARRAPSTRNQLAGDRRSLPARLPALGARLRPPDPHPCGAESRPLPHRPPHPRMFLFALVALPSLPGRKTSFSRTTPPTGTTRRPTTTSYTSS
jgi:hypothetical protein